MNKLEIAHYVDHTLLTVDATWEQVQQLCDEAVEYKTATVCIPCAYAEEAVKYLEGKIPVCVVVGFPNGYSTTEAKVFETESALKAGVAEIDMVINIGFLKSGRYEDVLNEIKQIKSACGNHILKVIIETCLLTEDEIVKMCQIVTESGAEYIKTSTGFSAYGATPEDVSIMVKNVGSNVKVKASGGIKSLEDAEGFLNIGVSRLGTSSIIRLLKEENTDNINSY